MINCFLIEFSIINNKTIEKPNRDERFGWFVSEIKNLSEIDGLNWLKTGIKHRKPSVVYTPLSRLIEEGYFDIILTTNWDSLLNDCFEKSNRTKNFKIICYNKYILY